LLVLVEVGRLTVLFTDSKFSFARPRDVWSKVMRDNVEKSILSCIVAQIPELFWFIKARWERLRAQDEYLRILCAWKWFVAEANSC
jgi:hypothetical protein